MDPKVICNGRGEIVSMEWTRPPDHSGAGDTVEEATKEETAVTAEQWLTHIDEVGYKADKEIEKFVIQFPLQYGTNGRLAYAFLGKVLEAWAAERTKALEQELAETKRSLADETSGCESEHEARVAAEAERDRLANMSTDEFRKYKNQRREALAPPSTTNTPKDGE